MRRWMSAVPLVVCMLAITGHCITARWHVERAVGHQPVLVGIDRDGAAGEGPPDQRVELFEGEHWWASIYQTLD